ncbi:MAG: copper amine oxidase N-terminal domain-containing protein, partial [Firmicutes bacterium]|nr:copper amine oxidase N-terminal domain-containing protein [Bacillota bacterium]
LSTRGFLDLTFNVDVDYDCDPGDVTVTVEGDSGNNIQDTDVVLAVVKDFGVSLSVEEVKTIYAGSWANELAEITIEQNADTSLVNNRYITVEIDNGRFSYTDESAVPTDSGLECTDVSESKIVYKVTENTQDDYVIKKLEIGTSINASGDVTLKFSGSAGVEGDLVVAKVEKPVTVTAENQTEVKIGVQGQAVGDIIIKETKAGAIRDEGKTGPPPPYNDDSTPQITLQCMEGFSFAGRPTAEVIEGDLKLDENNLVYMADSNNDGLPDQAWVIIDKKSKTASTIKFSNIKLNATRYVAEGPVTIGICDNAIVDPRSMAAYNAKWVAFANVATVVTPAPDEEKGNGMFIIGSNFYNQNGVMKMMDVAPYIKSDRTYVPVRYLAYVCGVADSGIAWDEATQTATLTKGDKVVKLVIGSKTLTVGDQTVEMDVAPEIYNGRTMLPARYVVEAFGGTVTWNEATKTVGVQF